VESLAGSAVAKERLRMMLETMRGDRTIEEASTQLGIAPSLFHRLRKRTLQEMVESLEPRKPGPTPKPIDLEKLEAEKSALAAEVRRLESELGKSRVREELARLRASGGEKKARGKKR
jgi:hypothetical protein